MLAIVRWVAWNALLAFIPVGLAYAIAALARGKRQRLLRYTALALMAPVWFAFLPNTCYLVTEWRHFLEALSRGNLVEQWMHDREALMLVVAYSIFFLGYSLLGLYSFTLAVRPIVPIVRRITRHLWILAIPFFILMALGVYLGLVLRFNSWDLLHQPQAIWESALYALSHPFLAALILALAVFLWLAYLFFDIWIDGYQTRRLQTMVESS